MLSTCIAIILFTSFIQGALIAYVVKWLDIELADDAAIDRRHRTIVQDQGHRFSIAMSLGGSDAKFRSASELSEINDTTFRTPARRLTATEGQRLQVTESWRDDIRLRLSKTSNEASLLYRKSINRNRNSRSELSPEIPEEIPEEPENLTTNY